MLPSTVSQLQSVVPELAVQCPVSVTMGLLQSIESAGSMVTTGAVLSSVMATEPVAVQPFAGSVTVKK